MNDRPTDAEIEAAARVLHEAGRHHGWFIDRTYEAMDPIGKREFDGIAERILLAARLAKNENSN
jgi:hypothetical protein